MLDDLTPAAVGFEPLYVCYHGFNAGSEARMRGADMRLVISVEPVPLVTEADGTVRLAHSRVTLDTVVAAFLSGATAEEIAHQYPSIDLGDVYAVISYYLRRRSEVDAYLLARRKLADATRTENESLFDPTGVRARLLARKAVGA